MSNKELGTQKARAVLKNLRVSPIKLNLVVAKIRGLKCDEALNQLSFSKKAIAIDVKKVLLSALANAQNNHGMDIDKLVVSLATVGKSITIKRFHARAKGRGVKIQKPFSHLYITLSEGVLTSKGESK